MYDAKGDLIKKLKKSEILDFSNISGISLYEDNRAKAFDLSQKEYPYTIEVKYETNYKFLYTIPNWSVLFAENVSIEKSEYIVDSPSGFKARYKLYNVSVEPEIIENQGRTVFNWKFVNYQAQEYEPFSKVFHNNPKVKLSPSKFKYDDYEGDMSTWDDIAKWQLELNDGRDQLKAETVTKIRELTAGLSTDEEKIKAIYEYVQGRTRYVSIQLGIGGLQPFEASLVDEVGYGDCKALSFYTQSLLKAAGVKSHYTWVSAGSNPTKIDPDFPNDNFNHIILCVPNKGDTVWLECTSQTIPFGYLGDFTNDRDVLLITEQGGKIVHTPRYEGENNQIVSNITVNLDQEGNGQAELKIIFMGLGTDYGSLLGYMNLDDVEKEKWIKRF